MTDEPQTAVEEAVERLESGLTNGDVQSSRFMYSDLRTILSALDALPPRPTDEAVRGLVERLTSVRSMGARKGKLWNADGPEAAALIRSQSAEIARLQAPDTGGEVERLRAALKPFAAFAEFEAALKERWPSGPVHPDGDAALVWNGGFGLTGPRFTHGDIREALAALEASQ